jgi:hypothetical protein
MVLSLKSQKPLPLHHRKRQANHHKRNKDYDKHYWPYLPLLAIIGLGFGLNIMWAPLSSLLTQHDVLGYATSTSTVGLLDETNVQRSTNGIAGLQANSLLAKAAQAKAEDMATRDYWSHTTPDGKEPWWFITNAGYSYTTVGENLAYGFTNSSTTISGWMNSAPHRANLLNSGFKEVGFGIANSPNYIANGEQTIVVAMYGTSAATAISPASQPVAATPASSTSSSAIASTKTATQPVAVAPTAIPNPDNITSSAAEPIAIEQDTAIPSVSATVMPHESQRVTRIETVATTLPAQSIAATVIIVAAAAGIFIYRHARALHRKFAYSEEFIVHHPFLDVIFIATITLGFVLTRTAGFIN